MFGENGSAYTLEKEKNNIEKKCRLGLETSLCAAVLQYMIEAHLKKRWMANVPVQF